MHSVTACAHDAAAIVDADQVARQHRGRAPSAVASRAVVAVIDETRAKQVSGSMADWTAAGRRDLARMMKRLAGDMSAWVLRHKSPEPDDDTEWSETTSPRDASNTRRVLVDAAAGHLADVASTHIADMRRVLDEQSPTHRRLLADTSPGTRRTLDDTHRRTPTRALSADTSSRIAVFRLPFAALCLIIATNLKTVSSDSAHAMRKRSRIRKMVARDARRCRRHRRHPGGNWLALKRDFLARRGKRIFELD